MEWAQVGWVDAAMLALLLASVLVGAVRGLTFELLSLAGWFAAWFAGLGLGPLLAPHLPVGEAGSTLNRGAAFACAFLGVLVVWSLAARAVASLIGKTPLRPLDRLLGAVFGWGRGALVLLAFAALVAYTPAVRSEAWRGSVGAVWLNAGLQVLLPWLATATGAAPELSKPPAADRV